MIKQLLARKYRNAAIAAAISILSFSSSNALAQEQSAPLAQGVSLKIGSSAIGMPVFDYLFRYLMELFLDRLHFRMSLGLMFIPESCDGD